jgi:hypothetical protein
MELPAFEFGTVHLKKKGFQYQNTNIDLLPVQRKPGETVWKHRLALIFSVAI